MLKSNLFFILHYSQKASEAALQGAAYRAKYAKYLHDLNQNSSSSDKEATVEEQIINKTNVEILSYNDFIIPYLPNHLERVCEPSKDSNEIYTPMLERCRQMANILQSAK